MGGFSPLPGNSTPSPTPLEAVGEAGGKVETHYLIPRLHEEAYTKQT